MGVSYEFLRKERVCAETSPLSCCCYTLLDILVKTLGDNHGTTQHLPPHNADSQHQQTFGLPSCMHQIEIGNYVWLQGGLLVGAQDNEKEATRCCYSNHCNTDEQYPHQERLVCISAVNK